MLTLRNLEKHYRSKKGQDHHALENINLEFGDKGFVFILGKSGSGKSTLLNILGGLDNFDSGDIVIKGKSSKDFKANDWDSYRNTYVGFVFQDFNIMENYSVAKNIGLALELQGVDKKDITKEINRILKSVDMEGYAKRKPNELSGGQLQRIAIARALVKSPEIILADEPTGNLDSITGKQIMENLKELSKDKLVIMVSHDAESANRYADRIVELKDGQVISDQVSIEGKFINKASVLSLSNINPKSAIYLPVGEKINKENLKEINKVIENEEIIYVPVSKAKLSENEINLINSLLNEDENILPIISKKETIEIKNNVIHRVESNEENLSRFRNKNLTKFKLIKSTLPIRNSIRMAFSSIWRKKLKMIFSILLFLVAVGLFGFSETVTKFNLADATAQTYANAKTKLITLSYSSLVKGWDKKETSEMPLNTTETKKLLNDYQYDYGLLYGFAKKGVSVGSPEKLVEPGQLSGFAVVNDLSKLDLKLMVGNMPKSSNDIMLTDFVVDDLIKKKIYKSVHDVLGKKFKIENHNYIITGVIDTDYENYLYLNNIPKSQYKDHAAEMGNFQNSMDSIYSRIFVKEGFYASYEKTFEGFSNVFEIQTPKVNAKDAWDNESVSNEIFKYSDSFTTSSFKNKFLFVPDGFEGLKENEVLINIDSIDNMNGSQNAVTTRKLIEKAIRNNENPYELLKERGYVGVEKPISIVRHDNWKRIDVRNVKIVGAVDFSSYSQYKNMDYFIKYFHDKNIDLSKYNININKIANPQDVQGQLTLLYVQHVLSDKGIKFLSDKEFNIGSIEDELKAEKINFLNDDEFRKEMIIVDNTLRAQETGKSIPKPSQTTENFINQGFRVNFDDKNISFVLKDFYYNYLNQIARENGITNNFDYFNYLQELASKNDIYVPSNQPDMWSPLIINGAMYDELNPFTAGKAQYVVVKLKDLESNRKFFTVAHEKGYIHKNPSGQILQTFEDFRSDAAHIFRYISLGLAIFATLLMYSNISSSVLASKKEIGTLRAIGAKGGDVAKIFVFEAIFIGIFTSTLATIILQIVTKILNNSLTAQLGLDISIFNSSLIIGVEMFVLSMIVVISAAFLPVKGVTIMKPINAIKNK